jgi:hypothetical protein
VYGLLLLQSLAGRNFRASGGTRTRYQFCGRFNSSCIPQPSKPRLRLSAP